ncbi:MAG TPA: DUF3014 domain-containing protein [Casimicrobiaceae bacterium]|nr:DUF3014 domain-containing protein [Casimicrobiaceae bacterium]
MKNPLVWLALAVVLAGVASFYYWQHANAPEPAAPPPLATAPAPPPAPETPRIEHPVPEAPAGAPLPPLADSDAAAKDALVSLFGSDAVVRMFITDAAVRRFVATVDNLPRKTTAARLMPVRPAPGTFEVDNHGGTLTIDAKNALRYRPYLVVMEGVEAKRLVAAYVRLYPLFQAAYQELGYPNGYFNDRLVQAIDDLLATPDVASPTLAQPKVLYEFADPALEDRSAGQKIMLRMGSANAARVKEKLRAIRRELTGQMAPQ